MRWYDVFAHTYDLQLEKLYRPWRERTVAGMGLAPGATVLVLGCGTGQDLDLLVDAVGPTGRVIGVDLSAGMLAKAQAKVAKAGWTNVTLLEGDVLDLAGGGVDAALGDTPLDAVLETICFTAVPDVAAAFEQAWSRLRPGGTFTMMDVHASKRTFQTKMVECLARAHLDRKVWEVLEAEAQGFEREVFDAPASTFGGDLFRAQGTKATTPQP